MLSAAAAVLLIAGGITVVNGHRSAAPPADGIPSPAPSVSAPAAPVSPFRQADIARQTLLDGDYGTPLIDLAEPVINNYAASHGTYPGQLVLRATCAGTGSFELYVDSQMKKRGRQTRLASLKVPCSAEPVPVAMPLTMTADAFVHTFRIHEAPERTVDKAGFAYQVYSKSGAPVTGSPEPFDEFDPDRRLDLTGREIVFEGVARPGSDVPGAPRPTVPAGDYALLTKCTGKPAIGRMTVGRLRPMGSGFDLIASADSPCTEPAGKQVETPVSWTGDPAEISFGLVTEEGLLHYALVRR
ncbi:hypothetical protein GCM10009828_028540 [Actinoplanes couchii]|uniref:Secreted protein n=1 Tax=Actinoplanes couchii TaxID=403638 RepID=A0ABQ3XCD1_9ACTN|nr:hypothetical protein Aco03nite_045810 [Actinoplanes couchii]